MSDAARIQGKYCYDWPRPAVTVDAVVLDRAAEDENSRVLLIRRGQPPYEGTWALPGGFIGIEEPLEDAVLRELREETGVVGHGARQIGAFGRPGRDPRHRAICVAFLIPEFSAENCQAGDDAAEARWWPVSQLPPLAFDHDEIIAAALDMEK